MNEPALETCTACGAGLRTGALFCGRCGVGVGSSAAPSPARVSLRPSLLPGERWATFKVALVLFGWVLGTSFVGMIAHQVQDSPWIDVAVEGADTLLVLGFAARHWASLRPVLRAPQPTPPLKTLLVLLGGLGLMNGYFMLLEALHVPFTRVTDDIVKAGWPLWTAYLLGAAQPAIVEEIACRGIVYDRLQRALDAHEALLIQAGMFSVLHLMPMIFPSHFVMGLVFGWLRVQSGSLIPGMLAHTAWNSWVIWSEL